MSRLQVPSTTVAPGSPMARRTKHEVKSARKLAKCRHKMSGHHWAKYLLSTCYSIWFIHLPSYVDMEPERAAVVLKAAYDLLGRLQKIKLQLNDEVCYRVMMQLCGVHNQPGTAVKLLLQMKKSGIQPNALTYGYYNRAVLEAKWPQEYGQSRLLWNKLRNVTRAVSYLSKLKESDKTGQSSTGSRDKLTAGSSSSLASLDQQTVTAAPQFAQFEKHCSRLGTIVKAAPAKLIRDSAVSSAGILISSQKRHSSSAVDLRSFTRRNSCTEFTTHKPASGGPVEARLRRGSMSPIQAEGLSFASDNLIMEKHNRTSHKMQEGVVTTPRRSVTERGDASTGAQRVRKESHGSRLYSRLTDMWRASEDSIASDVSVQDETPMKRKVNGKPPWGSSEILGTPLKGLKERQRSEQRAASESLDDPQKDSEYFRSQREGSEDQWSASINSSITDVSNLDGSKDEDSDRLMNGVRSGSEVSDRLPSGMVSPVRTPVTENDPLGALQPEDDNDLTITNLVDANNLLNKKHLLEMSTPNKQEGDIGTDGRKRSRIECFFDGSAELFTSNIFDREKTPPKNASDQETQKRNMQRSSTLPGAVAEVPPLVASPSLGFLSSPFKLPFSRMSPSRASLRKAELKICRTLENAISGSKKNEILQAGLSTVKSVKSAATIMAKKFEEVISTNTTPVKSLNASQEILNGDPDATSERSNTLDFEGWGNLKELFVDSSRSSRKSSTAVPSMDEPVSEDLIRETLYRRDRLGVGVRPLALTLTLTTCSRCTGCANVLHDEEIVAGWTSDDSNLNTKCHFCDQPTLPFLSVTIHDYRAHEKGSDRATWNDAKDTACRTRGEEAFMPEAISVPYLNPLVLRKELESILQHKGDPSLTHASFVDQHPIIYWNMIWWFERISVQSHLPRLLLTSQTLDKKQTIHPSWENVTDDAISVVCLWDNPRLHEEVGQPMYMIWQEKEQQSSLVSALVTDRNAVSKRDIAKIISYLKMDNLKDPMLLLVKERAKQAKKGHVQGRSLYRDILYLALVEFGRNAIDLETFEREYKVEFEKMTVDGVSLQKCDRPPVSASFRNYFAPLLLLQETS